MMMVKVTGLYILIDESIKAEDFNFNYPDPLTLYIIKSSIGVKSFQNLRCSRLKKNGVIGLKN